MSQKGIAVLGRLRAHCLLFAQPRTWLLLQQLQTRPRWCHPCDGPCAFPEFGCCQSTSPSLKYKIHSLLPANMTAN